MKITILTLFPEMFTEVFDHSIIKNAREKGAVTITTKNIRDFGIGKHQVVDDTPYGGGVGMVLRVDVLHGAIISCRDPLLSTGEEKVIYLGAKGKRFVQKKAAELSTLKHLIILCGHYEGVDERIKAYIDEEISLGDFILTGGELGAMVLTDAIVRLLPDVLKPGVTNNESFSLKTEKEGKETYYLEYPQYTRPEVYEEKKVPDILLSGHHQKIEEWRKENSVEIQE